MYEGMIELLHKEVALALGCTEPIAVALAAVKCKETLGKIPETIEILASTNILKNGMGVGIPGTGMVGLHIAAVLGVTGGNSSKLLEVLSDIKQEDIKLAKIMLNENRVNIKRKNTSEKLYIEVLCKYDNEYSRVVIRGSHTNIVLVESNGKKISEEEGQDTLGYKEGKNEIITVEDIYKFINEVYTDKIIFLLHGSLINKKLSDEALANHYGLAVGKNFYENVKYGRIEDFTREADKSSCTRQFNCYTY